MQTPPIMAIPILNLTRQYDRLKSQIDEALIRVASSGHYILGPEVQAFEAEMSAYLGVKHVIGCASGTDALFLALRALKIGFGDEVITTPFSYVATSEAIAHTGACPVFVDIDAGTMNIDPTLIEAAITSKTKAILPVHLYGQPAKMDEIRAIAEKHNLAVVEDCAQAIAATYVSGDNPTPQKIGTLGDIGCFSFFPSKNLGAFGDGGMCVTNDDVLAERLRMLRVHGARVRYYHEEAGLNSRLDEIQAAILRMKLPHLEEWTHARNVLAEGYDRLLAPLSAQVQPPLRQPNVRHAFHQYTVQLQLPSSLNLEAQSKIRESIREAMQAAGVQTMIYYPLPLYLQGTHANLNLNPADYPVCEQLSAIVLSLPMFPELRNDEQARIVEVLNEALTLCWPKSVSEH
jgi:dTDP-4-amino-4,6-dideoxygalactose transaminase